MLGSAGNCKIGIKIGSRVTGVAAATVISPVCIYILAELLAAAVGPFVQPGVGINSHLFTSVLADVHSMRDALENGKQSSDPHKSEVVVKLASRPRPGSPSYSWPWHCLLPLLQV